MDTLKAVDALSALAQGTRLAVFRMLVADSEAADGCEGDADISGGDGGVVGGGDGGKWDRDRGDQTNQGAARGLSAGVIAEQLRVPPATLSFHLSKLEKAGLIKARRRSLNIFYSADHAGIRALVGFLTEDCCQGRPELCGVRLPRLSPETSEQSSPGAPP